MKKYKFSSSVSFFVLAIFAFVVASFFPVEVSAQLSRRYVYRLDTVCRGETGYHITRAVDTLFYETFDNGLPLSWTRTTAQQNGSGFNALTGYDVYNDAQYGTVSAIGTQTLFEYPLGVWPTDAEALMNVAPESLTPAQNSYLSQFISMITTPRFVVADPSRTTMSLLFFCAPNVTYGYPGWTDGSVFHDEVLLSCYNFDNDNTTRINNTTLFHFNSDGNEFVNDDELYLLESEPADFASLTAGSEAQCRFAHVNRGGAGFGIDSILIMGPRRVDIPSEVTLASLGTSLTTEQTYIVDGYDTTIVVTTWYIGNGSSNYGPALDTAVCDSLVWQYGNRTASVSAQPVVVGTNRCGGDSIRMLTLTVHQSSQTTATNVIGSAQLPYTWGGVTFSEGGTINDTLTDRYGCDSVIVKTLTVLPPSAARTIERYDTICQGETGYHVTREVDTLLYEDFDNGTPTCWSYDNAALNGSGFNALTGYDIYNIPNYYGTMSALGGLTLFEYPLAAWPPEAENLIGNTVLSDQEQIYMMQFISTASTPRFVIADPSRTSMKLYMFCGPNAVYGDAVYVDGATFYDEVILSCFNFDADNTTRINSSPLFHFNSDGNEFITDDYWYLMESTPADFSSLTAGAEAQCRFAHVNRGGAGFGIDSILIIGPRRVDIPAEVTAAMPGSTISTTEQVYRTGCTPTTIITHWYIRPRDTYAPAALDTAVCDSLVWAYGTRYASTTAEPVAIGTSSCGGDSLLLLNLTVNHSRDSILEPQTFCSSIEWNGTTYTTNTTDTKHFTTAIGQCDSSVTATFILNTVDTVQIVDAVCAGATYTFNGTPLVFHTDTVYRDSTALMQNRAGCDSITFLTLTVNAPLVGDTSATACDSFAWHGSQYNADTMVQNTYVNAAGCDSVVSLHLTINSATSSVDSVSACENYTWQGQTITVDTTITQNGTNAAGCDSMTSIIVAIQHAIVVPQSVSACDSYVLNGETFDADTTVSYAVSGMGVCDSIYEVHLTVNHSSFADTQMTACDSLLWIDGITYYSSTTTQHTATNAAGCDSVITLILSIKRSSSSESTLTACDSIVWGGTTYYSSDSIQQTLTNAAECDSIVTIHFTINHSTTYTTAFTACKSYVWNGLVITADTVLTQREPNPSGCDNIGTIYIDIKDTVQGFQQVVTCDNVPWRGRLLRADTVVYDTLFSLASCDTVMQTTVRVHHTAQTSTSAAACNSYRWNGMTFVSDTIVSQRLTSAAGCDSTVYMRITIKHDTYGDTSASACDSYSWYEHQAVTISRSDLTHRFVAANGCDSTVRLHLTIRYGSNRIDRQTACDSYTWIDGITYAYSTTLPSVKTVAANGCDSIITLYLTLNHSTVRDDTMRTALPFSWHGTVHDTTGVFKHNIPGGNSVGCDSLDVLHLFVSPEYMRPKIKCYELKNLLMVDHYPMGPDTKRVDYGGYRWYRCDHPYGLYVQIPGATNDYYADTLGTRYLPLGGCYFAEVLVAGSYMHSDTICVNSGKSLAAPLSLSVYPNPVAVGHLVTISATGVDDNGTIEIYDMLGRLVVQMPAASGDNYITVDTKGTYSIILHTGDNETVARKLIVR